MISEPLPCTRLLAAILQKIGASQYLPKLTDDGYDDESLVPLSMTKPAKLSSRYGMPLQLAVAFVEKCRIAAADSSTRSPVASSSCAATAADASDSFVSSPTFPPPSSSSASTASLHPSFTIPSSAAATRGPTHASAPPQQQFPASLRVAGGPAPSHPSAAAASASDSDTDAGFVMRQLNLEVVAELGKGAFGTVFKCKHMGDKRWAAVKFVNDAKHSQEVANEGQRLAKCSHDHIVRMHKVHLSSLGVCVLEMEFVPGGDLSQHLEAARQRPDGRLPPALVIRFARQLLDALVYLHDKMRMLHGDIKPQNILMSCSPLPADASTSDIAAASLKLADFGLAKSMFDSSQAAMSFMVSNASTKAGVFKGTVWYMCPEALQGAAQGRQRCFADDVWSACLVILEMDTGLTLQQLMTAPGAVNINALLTKTSPQMLPVICSGLAADPACRCGSAAELLQLLDSSIDPLFVWQLYDVAAHTFTLMHSASAFVLEKAFSANQPAAILTMQPPFDLNFDLRDMLLSAVALGSQTQRSSGISVPIRRVLKSSALTSSAEIPVWQQLVDGKAWQQCSPSLCAKFEIDVKKPNAGPDSAIYRRLLLHPASIGSAQLPFPFKSEPYCTPAHADDIAMLNRRVHDSLPEWDVSHMVQVVNPSLASKYASYRHRVAARCNGDPNESLVFHFASDSVVSKIWQEGEGHDPRLSNWAEVGKGAYFSKHVMYGYAYKYKLWPSFPDWKAAPEPPVGSTMCVFATLVSLGNVADMGAGCETCPSPAWDDWKKEFDYQKTADNPSPKPTRPPAMPQPADAAPKQHLLDLMQVKDAPRYDSVMSTEGDLATHPASTNKDAAGQRMCDVMHPRLRARAKEWAMQYVLFDTSASCPMFICTLTKTRDSPMGPQQLLQCIQDAGCNASLSRALGFTALQLKDAGCSAQQLKSGGFSAAELRAAGADALSLVAGGYSVSDLKHGGFEALQLKNAGVDVHLIAVAGYDVETLKQAGFGDADLQVRLRCLCGGIRECCVANVDDSYVVLNRPLYPSGASVC
jgi:serine/threonine protein kinase